MATTKKKRVYKEHQLKGKKRAALQGSDVLGIVDDYAHDIGMLMVNQFAKLLCDQPNPLKSLVQAGNLKIPKTTAIFNMSSAQDCASLALGLCKACELNELKELITVCYAMKAERQYPAVIPYRQRQERVWLEITAEEFVTCFLRINAVKRNKFTKLRVNEAGDFHTQECVSKLDQIAKILSKYGVVTYCYTARDDLDFSKVKSLVVNGSSFMKDGIANEFRMIQEGDERPKGMAQCPADCRICDRCSIPGKSSYVYKH
jgi:hypothetical protein